MTRIDESLKKFRTSEVCIFFQGDAQDKIGDNLVDEVKKMWMPNNPSIYMKEELDDLERSEYLKVHVGKKVQNCLTLNVGINLDIPDSLITIKDDFTLDLQLTSSDLS